MQLNNHPGTCFNAETRPGLLHKLALWASPRRSIRPKPRPSFSPRHVPNNMRSNQPNSVWFWYLRICDDAARRGSHGRRDLPSLTDIGFRILFRCLLPTTRVAMVESFSHLRRGKAPLTRQPIAVGAQR